jgi:hypothetical protein
MPDYKQLCAEGVAFIRSATDPDDLSINAEKWADKARAAIREVAAWMREQQDGDLIAATMLEQEAGR